MYPKVKVREEEEYDRYTSPLPPFFPDLSSTVIERIDDSPPVVVRIPMSNLSRPPILPASKEKPLGKKGEAEIKQNIRASPVPRPRAVLSSPNNDGTAGNRNKARAGLLSGLKSHNSCQNRHVKCKEVAPRHETAARPASTKKEATETIPKEKTPVIAARRGKMQSLRGT